MWFGVLGPLVVFDEAGSAVEVDGTRLRVLLAALLLQANKPVSQEALAEVVWDGVPPPAVAHTLRSHVARLRRLLGDQSGRVVTRPPGYLIAAGPTELDVLEFDRLAQAAGTAVRAGAWQHAADAGARALGLWRGEPLMDVPSDALRDRIVPRLERLRLQVLEDHAEAVLHLGRHEQLLADLHEMVAAYPLRERLRGQLMLALYRSGRRAEAVAVYHDACAVLTAELRTRPGPELRHLHERILAGDDELAAPLLPASPAFTSVAPPRQLPAAARHFTGRRSEVALIQTLLGQPQDGDDPGPGPAIVTIDGMAGIGKTTLAIHAAHRLAEQYPDGQLFIDLHGYTPGQRPRSAGEALSWLLRALGTPAAQIPVDSEEAAGLYRQRLADARVLIVLDNAADEAQVRPLVPGGGSCLLLVTSRRRLKALDDAQNVPLDLLPPSDAVTLLGAAIGRMQVSADSRTLVEVAGLCGYLPLALRIAGALLRHRPAWSLDYLVGLLREQHTRVGVLSDGERDLATVFDLSYRSLDERHQTLFRRLGLIAGPDVDAYAAAAIMGIDRAAAIGLLEDLVDHNLLVCHAPGRYRLHDLMRAHTRNLVARDPGSESDCALDRLLRYYAYTAHTASMSIARYPRPALTGPAPAHMPHLVGPESARGWLRAERDNLEAAVAQARASALDEHAIALTAGLAEILRSDGPFTRAVELHQAAADLAQHQRYRSSAAHGNALTDLGIMRLLVGDPAAAGNALGRAWEIFRAIGHRHGEANAFAELGVVRRLMGDLAGAGDDLRAALEIFRAIGDRQGQAHALTELGRVRQLSGDLAGAGDALGQALEIFRALDHRHGEANALTELGVVRRLIGDLAGAADALGLALRLFREIGHRHGEAYALTELGTVRRLAGDPAGVETFPRALEIFRAIGHQHGEAWALTHYAAAVAVSDVPRALALYQQALAINHELGKPDDEATALEGIGECYLSSNDTVAAITYLGQALEVFIRLGMAHDTRRVRNRLDSLHEKVNRGSSGAVTEIRSTKILIPEQTGL